MQLYTYKSINTSILEFMLLIYKVERWKNLNIRNVIQNNNIKEDKIGDTTMSINAKFG